MNKTYIFLTILMGSLFTPLSPVKSDNNSLALIPPQKHLSLFFTSFKKSSPDKNSTCASSVPVAKPTQAKKSTTIESLATDLVQKINAGKIEDAQSMLSAVKGIDSEGFTLLHEASSRNDILFAQFLINHGVDINTKSKMGITALHVAAALGLTDMVRYLIANGANKNIVDSHAHIPEDLAASCGYPKIAQLLAFQGLSTSASSSTMLPAVTSCSAPTPHAIQTSTTSSVGIATLTSLPASGEPSFGIFELHNNPAEHCS